MPEFKNPENYVILIVTKTATQLGILFDYLYGYGFGVLVADDGESALAIAEMSDPDIILLDVILPTIDGFETCRRLKESPQTAEIPVIFMTSLANTVDKVRGFSLGAVDYLTKPIQSEEVLARLKAHLTIKDLQTSLQNRNAQLHQEIQEREKLIAELDSFAHTVAHDLKNPLGVTINYAQFLNKFSAQMSIEEIEQYAETILQNGQKMVSIIDELLLLASVRTEEIELKPLDMSSIISEAQSRLAHLIEESQAEIITPQEWPVSLGYGPWIEEVWANYLSNAIKYGGNPPKIEVGATVRGDGMVQYWIHDNGEGLTPDAQAQLFVPFNRLNQSRAEGHGLGLSIVERIVKKLGGSVGVESEGVPGQGSIFSFYLQQHENGADTPHA